MLHSVSSSFLFFIPFLHLRSVRTEECMANSCVALQKKKKKRTYSILCVRWGKSDLSMEAWKSLKCYGEMEKRDSRICRAPRNSHVIQSRDPENVPQNQLKYSFIRYYYSRVLHDPNPFIHIHDHGVIIRTRASEFGLCRGAWSLPAADVLSACSKCSHLSTHACSYMVCDTRHLHMGEHFSLFEFCLAYCSDEQWHSSLRHCAVFHTGRLHSRRIPHP